MDLKAFSVLTTVAISLAFATGCNHKDDKPTQAPPARVDALVIAPGNFTTAQIYSGTVASAGSSTVSFAVAGTIEELYAAEGQRVAQGQLLGRLKGGNYVNANNIAQAELAEAEDAYQRLKKLHDANALPEIKWVEVQQKLTQARNAADISSRALKETELLSPMDGVVSRKLADRGQNVAPIEPVYEIVSTDELTVDISVPETEVGLFAVGQNAAVAFDGKKPFEGKVTQKSVVADPLTRSYTIKIAIPSPQGNILPGMVGTVSFAPVAEGESADSSQSVLLPSQAVNLSDDNRTFVWTVVNGKACQRFVESNELSAAGVVVTSGLEPGDTVIVAGMQKVGTGTEVEIVNFK